MKHCSHFGTVSNPISAMHVLQPCSQLTPGRVRPHNARRNLTTGHLMLSIPATHGQMEARSACRDPSILSVYACGGLDCSPASPGLTATAPHLRCRHQGCRAAQLLACRMGSGLVHLLIFLEDCSPLVIPELRYGLCVLFRAHMEYAPEVCCIALFERCAPKSSCSNTSDESQRLISCSFRHSSPTALCAAGTRRTSFAFTVLSTGANISRLPLASCSR